MTLRIASFVLGVALAIGVPIATPAALGATPAELRASTVCVLQDLPQGRLKASGFAVGKGNLILTTAHKLDATRPIRVKLVDGRIFPVTLLRIGNERADLALLKLEATAPLPAVELRSAATLQPGEPIIAIGCPAEFEFTVTSGVISAVRDSPLGYELIQTDVPVNEGSSGGPLFDANGMVIGIVKGAAIDRNRIHIALPADLGQALLDDVERIDRAYELFNRGVLEPLTSEKARVYRKLLKLAPDFALAHFAWHNLGLALERQGRKAQALAAYTRALELSPEFVAPALNAGLLLLQARRTEEACRVYGLTLEEQPSSVRLRSAYGQCLALLERWDLAREQLEEAVRNDASYAPARYNLGQLCEARGDLPCAREQFEKYLQLAPDAADAASVRGRLQNASAAAAGNPTEETR